MILGMANASTILSALRRWLRFSLRTVFVLMGVLCVVLGQYVNRAQRQKLAVEWIANHGGQFCYDDNYVRIRTEPMIIDSDEVEGYALGTQCDENGNEIEPQANGPEWLRELLGTDYV